ncbi:MAG: hypothetical protein M3N42_15005 [Cyanobacteriota bacterium]|nr:hypothetical protein [Cyanobacteriota bacterium]
MIPAPVSRSATTVPGSGIAVGLTGVGAVYMFVKFNAGAASGSVTGNRGIGSCVGAGDDSTAGSTNSGTGDSTGCGSTSGTGDSIGCGASCTRPDSMGDGATTGVSCTGAFRWDAGDGGGGGGGGGVGLPLMHSVEKLPGPHTSTAEAGGAAAR